MNSAVKIILLMLIFSQIPKVFAWRKGVKSRTLFVEDYLDSSQSWLKTGLDEKESIKAIIRILATAKTGKKILALSKRKANQSGKSLLDIISPGPTSICDTSLIRRFYPNNPDKVAYETRSKVRINRDLSIRDAVMDLAHELTHYSYRIPFNPYQVDFILKEFIVSIIEGKGGEVDAYMAECQVLKELNPNRISENSNCHKIMKNKDLELSKIKGIHQFYQVGQYHLDFIEALKKFGLNEQDFPYLSDKVPLFISSAYDLPYPLAAIKEYISIMKKACKNDKKRLAIYNEKFERTPASSYELLPLSKMARSYSLRCNPIIGEIELRNLGAAAPSR